MQFITIASALFAATVLAVPAEQAEHAQQAEQGEQGKQAKQCGPNNWGPGGGWPIDGDENGHYQGNCFCTRQGQPDWDLTDDACNDLASAYPNLQSIGTGCIDNAGRGVEQNGFRTACQRNTGQFDVIDVKCTGGFIGGGWNNWSNRGGWNNRGWGGRGCGWQPGNQGGLGSNWGPGWGNNWGGHW